MKVLFLSKRVSTGNGLLIDRCSRLHELSTALADLGHEVTGVCFSHHKGLAEPAGHTGKSTGTVMDQTGASFPV